MKFPIHNPKSLLLIRGLLGGALVALSFLLAPLLFKYLFFASFAIVLAGPAVLGTFYNKPELRAAFILAFPLIILFVSAAGTYLSKLAMEMLLWLPMFYIVFAVPLHLLASHFSKKSKLRLSPVLGFNEFCVSLVLIAGLAIFLSIKVPVYFSKS